MQIRIAGRDLPDLADVAVGVQRKAEVVERVPARAGSAVWEFAVTAREIDGLLDVGGPWVHGRPGARFLYLSWGRVDGDAFRMFRRAKLLFGDIPTAMLRAAFEGGGVLVAGLGLTDEIGGPRGGRVRPPDVVWSLR